MKKILLIIFLSFTGLVTANGKLRIVKVINGELTATVVDK